MITIGCGGNARHAVFVALAALGRDNQEFLLENFSFLLHHDCANGCAPAAALVEQVVVELKCSMDEMVTANKLLVVKDEWCVCFCFRWRSLFFLLEKIGSITSFAMGVSMYVYWECNQ